MNWKTSIIPKSTCPHCGYEMDRSENQYGNTPGPGDISLCIKCGGISAFQKDMTMRRVTAMDMLKMDHETLNEVRRVQAAIKELNKK